MRASLGQGSDGGKYFGNGLKEIPHGAGDSVRVVILVAPEGLIGVVIKAVAQEEPDIVAEAARDPGGHAVILGSGSIGHAVSRIILVIVGAVIEVAQGSGEQFHKLSAAGHDFFHVDSPYSDFDCNKCHTGAQLKE
jgi:hypothetical protein